VENIFPVFVLSQGTAPRLWLDYPQATAKTGEPGHHKFIKLIGGKPNVLLSM
jgi:hypothetical protein